jgi:hypothetical protein
MVATVENEAGLTTFVGQGEMTAEELFTAFSYFLDAGATPLTLWDLSRACLAELDPESIRTLARKVAHAAKGRRPPGRTAVVCGRRLDFGMVHMLAAYLSIEGYPVEMATFTSMESAKTWVLSDVPK